MSNREGMKLGSNDVAVGARWVFERDVTEEDVLLFARLSGDENPLHVDPGYAASTNFGRRLAHGALQASIASSVLGMHLPGKNVLLGGIKARFPAPLRFPTRISVAGRISSWNPETLGGRLEVTITDIASRARTAEVFFSFTLHDVVDGREPLRKESPRVRDRVRTTVLVTGAAGALGSAVCRSLASDYDVIAVHRSRPLPDELSSHPRVTGLAVDLSEAAAFDSVAAAVAGRPLYGVVHAAWPGAPAGGLLDAEDDVVTAQITAGTSVPIALARVIFRAADPGGGRLILIGSTAGSFKPYVPKGAYSLGKAALEATARLLAPELARKRITVNVISPAFIAAGINEGSTERQRLIESATIPLGRLCTLDDVTGMTRFLLSDAGSFVSGQNIVLSGAQI